MSTEHPSTNLSESELLLELGFATKPTKPSKPEKVEDRWTEGAGKSFLTAQYPIFSTPLVIVYLQGPAAFVDTLSTDPQTILTSCFANAKVRKLGRAGVSPELTELTKKFIDNKWHTKLYTDKEWHKNYLTTLLEHGLTLDKNKAANRHKALESINKYLEDLVTFLTNRGYNSNLEYIESQYLTKGKVQPMQITTNDWDDL